MGFYSSWSSVRFWVVGSETGNIVIVVIVESIVEERWKPLTTFAKRSILDDWLGSEYASEDAEILTHI